ncbi:MAG: hypothetical protein H6626_00330 [Pseudobdellovibrionaceae bacterium]|nr:hypothetical protein [Bdellovibrionales bacterium]USN47575.1 MAG: hypothetical protein H6626_00330 [Pseudobdellovibrionaceae bacterium]
MKAKESARIITPELTDLKIIADQELIEKLEKIRGLLAHKTSQLSHCELLHAICDIAIEDLKPKKPSQKDLQNVDKTTAQQVCLRQ